MSAVGLTKAMRMDMERLADISIRRFDKLFEAGMATICADDFKPRRNLTPRGHAALAAPRMTQAELEMLERLTTRQLHCELSQRVLRKLRAKGYCESTSAMTEWITDAGLKALNDVRAATGSELYKDNMP